MNSITLHNIPEGIAGTSSLISEGYSRRRVYRMWIALVIASAVFGSLIRFHVPPFAGAAVAFGAHFAKGNAAGKEHLDRVSGSGVWARDPDAIITATRHEEDDAFAVEMTLRNFAPVEQDITALAPRQVRTPKPVNLILLGLPVGKDSLSMRTVWQTTSGEAQKMTAPLSLIVSAFAPVRRAAASRPDWATVRRLRASRRLCTGMPSSRPRCRASSSAWLKVLEKCRVRCNGTGTMACGRSWPLRRMASSSSRASTTPAARSRMNLKRQTRRSAGKP